MCAKAAPLPRPRSRGRTFWPPAPATAHPARRTLPPPLPTKGAWSMSMFRLPAALVALAAVAGSTPAAEKLDVSVLNTR